MAEQAADRFAPGALAGRALRGAADAARRRDVPFALAVIGVLVILLIPVPTFLLDMLLAMSLALSILILITALYIEKPLDFNAFPTVLLISTLFRLSLNIASTRLILSHGQNGANAAGRMIEAFGSFVMADSVVIGFIVFAILTVINFVVITKGSGRIAEVAARFSLDAMPGKQMAVDADVAAGVLNEEQAKHRRQELQEESAFYGAMDGASKFVRGDAVAGLLITFINLVGGLVIGMAQGGMDFSEAADTYTKLSVGDGLVSQIPALIISTAAGMVISKTGVSGRANKAVLDQLARYPEAAALLSALMFLLATIPGIPPAPFLALSGASGYLAYRLYGFGGAKQAAGASGTPGVPPGDGPSAGTTGGSAKAAAQDDEPPVSEALRIDPIRLELGYGLLPLVNYKTGTPLPKQVKTLRRELAKEIGFVLPSVRIQDNMQLPHYEYVIRIKELECARGSVKPDKLLAMNPQGGPVELPGEDTREPAFGLPAKWINENAREEALFRNYTVADPPTVISTHLTETVKENVTELLGYTETQKLLDEAATEHKKLVDDTVPDKITVGGMQRVLQNLLAERVSVRDMPAILEAALEAATITKSLTQITEYVRRRLSRQICRMYLNKEGALEALMLSQGWEQLFLEHLEGPPDEKRLAAPPGRLQEFVNGAKRALSQHRAKGEQPVLIVHPSLRPHIRAVLERALPGMPVLSQGEIHPKMKLKTLGQV